MQSVRFVPSAALIALAVLSTPAFAQESTGGGSTGSAVPFVGSGALVAQSASDDSGWTLVVSASTGVVVTMGGADYYGWGCLVLSSDYSASFAGSFSVSATNNSAIYSQDYVSGSMYVNGEDDAGVDGGCSSSITWLSQVVLSGSANAANFYTYPNGTPPYAPTGPTTESGYSSYVPLGGTAFLNGSCTGNAYYTPSI